MRSCLLIERRLLDAQVATAFVARMALADVPVVEVELPLTAKVMLAAVRGAGADSGWLICGDATVIGAAATAGLAGVVLIGAAVPGALGEDHGLVVAEARDLSDAPRVMIPRDGGCWHEHRRP